MVAIHLSQLRFHYPDRPAQPILNIPEWSVQTGEHLFVHGPSGSGKSTLLNLLSGLLRPASGQLTLFDHRLDQMRNRQLDRFRANQIGYVFQQLNLIPYLNAVDNIRLGAQFSALKKGKSLSKEILGLLAQLNVAEQDWTKPITQLSLGQQQRVAIARSLINKPRLIIADEPTSALDQNNRDAFLSVLLPLARSSDITLLFISHDVTLASHFSRSEALSDFNQV